LALSEINLSALIKSMEQKKFHFLQFGLLSAGVSILFYVILYLAGVEYFLSLWAYLAIVIYILFAVIACLNEKKTYGGYLEFSNALKTSFGIFVISSFAATIFSYVLLNFIDTDFKIALDRYAIIVTEKYLKSWGMQDAELNKTITDLKNTDYYSLNQMLLNFAYSCIFWFLFALIISAIIKKKNPSKNMSL
jgi:hypothetical protein